MQWYRFTNKSLTFVTRDDSSLELLKSYEKQFIEYQARNGSQTVNLNRFETIDNAYFTIRSLPIGLRRKTAKKIAAYVAETCSKLFGKSETQKLRGKQESDYQDLRGSWKEVVETVS